MYYNFISNRLGHKTKSENVIPKKPDVHTEKHCDICNAEAEKPCPIGGFVVRLNPVYIANSKIMICQSCLNEHFTLTS